MASLTFKLNERLFIKDPQQTELGQKIISKSVEMIDQLGFELFNFKKLAAEINSTEASVYRYFENKHRLLLYLVAWYWSWIEYRIDISTSNLAEPEDKLRASIKVITEKKEVDPSFAFVNEVALDRIVIAELDKAYLTKGVDQNNKEGLFGGFKALCKKLAMIITQVEPSYMYAHSLASTIVLAAKQQIFFASHLPSLSSAKYQNGVHDEIYSFIEKLAFGTLNHGHHA